MKREIVIIGGGPRAWPPPFPARESGVEDVLIIEREPELGGILNQCIHNGFGLHTFKEELTGPEYAARFIESGGNGHPPLGVHHGGGWPARGQPVCHLRQPGAGLADCGGRGRCLGHGLPGAPPGRAEHPRYPARGHLLRRAPPSGLSTLEGYLPGKEVVILGSGDIGLIMARRMTLEGAKVKCVAELMPYSGGLKRNIVQCLNDYGIPLKLSHTVIDIRAGSGSPG